MKTIKIESERKELNKISSDLCVEVKGDCELVIIDSKINELNIKVLDGASLIINEFNFGDNRHISLNVTNKAVLTYNLSCVVKDNNDLKIDLNYLGDDSKIECNIHSLVSGNETIKMVGSVSNNKENNTLLENVKVILEGDGSSSVTPDMLIDTNLVSANHKVAISSISKEYLFYLMSKGISEKSSEELLKKSFLISNITDKDLILKIKDNL